MKTKKTKDKIVRISAYENFKNYLVYGLSESGVVYYIELGERQWRKIADSPMRDEEDQP